MTLNNSKVDLAVLELGFGFRSIQEGEECCVNVPRSGQLLICTLRIRIPRPRPESPNTGFVHTRRAAAAPPLTPVAR